MIYLQVTRIFSTYLLYSAKNLLSAIYLAQFNWITISKSRLPVALFYDHETNHSNPML